nr:ribonuclease H-like domain-containing protein [Tanacetum cinerariifolium]
MKVIEVYIELWLSVIDYESMSNPLKMSTIDTDVPESMSSPLPMKKIGVASKPKKFLKKLSKKALSKEVFEQWDWVESDIHNDHIQILHMQTEKAKEQGVDVVDIRKQGVDVAQIGKNREGFTEHQIEISDDFKDEELNLEDFDSETSYEGDVEAERNKALRKLAKPQLFQECMVSKDNFFVGRKFGDKSLVLKMVSMVAIEQRRQLHVYKNDKFRVMVKCNGQTPVFKTFIDVNPAEEGGSGFVDKLSKEVEWNGDDKYQVTVGRGDKCVVNMSTKVYTCRRWELTGIPCKHVVAAINDMGNNDMVIVGKPPKKRKKSAMKVEEMVKHGKLTRAGKTVRCLLCKQLGHNRRSCKGQTMAKTNPRNKKMKTAAQGKSRSQPPPVSSQARPSQVQQICLYMHDLREPHFSALKQILRYVRGTLDYGLQLFSSSTTPLVAYSDANWAGCPTTRRSTSVQHQHTKHIEIDIHFVRDLVATGKVRVLHVPSRYQFADIFTKGLPSALFEEFRSNLSIWCPPAPTTGKC